MHTSTSDFSIIPDNPTVQTTQKHLKHHHPPHVSQVRDELEQLLDDDDDMAELYLSRKAAFNFSALSSPRSPPSPSLAAADAFSPSLASKTYAPRTATHTTRSTGEGAEDVEELEMLMEVYYSQIDVTLNKLNTVGCGCLLLLSDASFGVLAR